MKKYIFAILAFAVSGGLSSVFARVPLAASLSGQQKSGLSFIENKGQWNPQAKYKADIPGGVMFITDKGFVYNYVSQKDLNRIDKSLDEGKSIAGETMRFHAYKVNFVGAHTAIQYLPTEKRSNYNNYFIGNDKSKWAGGVPLYGKVQQQNIYDGIDMVVYTKNNSFKYDFIVAPGADPAQIKLAFEGVKPVITRNGDLQIKTTVNEVIEKAPYTYQLINGKEIKVASSFKMINDNLTFAFPEGYNQNYPLIIDPTLVFCTYSGGTGGTVGLSGANFSYSTTYDAEGNAYAACAAYCLGWPTTTGAFQTTYNGGAYPSSNVGINKYNTDGTNLIYSTYYGGSSGTVPNTLRVNSSGELVVAGGTNSSDQPCTTGCYDSISSSSMDIYVAHFNATGTALIGATYIGGSGAEPIAYSLTGFPLSYSGGTIYNIIQQNTTSPVEINFDPSGNIWVVSSSSSTDFPVSANAQQSTNAGGSDGVIFKLNSDCSQLLYSSYLGGSNDDAIYGLQYNNTGNIVICGATKSSDFPTTTGALNTTAPGGIFDGFVSIVNPNTGAILNTTYVGTSAEDQAVAVQVDENNDVYVLGRTRGNYPVSSGVYSVTNGDIFIDKLSSDLSSSLLSTRMGQSQTLNTADYSYFPDGFLLDNCGNIYISGAIPNYGNYNNMPLTTNAFQSTAANFWFGVLKPNFSDLLYGTYFGIDLDHSHCGVNRFDPNGIIYHSICSGSTGNSYPFTTPNAWAPNKLTTTGTQDIVTFKFDFEATGVQSHIELPSIENDSVCVPYTMQFDNNSTSPYDINYIWNFGDGSTSTAITPSHTFTTPGVYDVILHAHSDTACINDSYDTMRITVLQTFPPDISVNDTTVCSGVSAIDLNVTINNPSPYNTIQWGPQAGLVSPGDQPTVSVNPAASSVYYVVVKDTIPGICGFSSSDTVHVDYSPRNLNIITNDTVVCEGSQVQVVAEATPGFDFAWAPSTGVDDTTALNPVITVNQPLTYTLTATHEGCPDTAQTLTIGMQYIPHIELGPDMEVCQWAPVSLASNVSPFRTDYIYQWTPPGALQNADGANAEFIADTSIMYYFHVATPIGCSANDSIHVTVFPGNFGDASIDTGYCPPASVQLWASGGSGYQWVPDYGLSDANIANPVATPGTSTDYTVYITDIHGCRDTQQVSIQVYPLAILQMPDSVTVYPGESYHLQPSTNALYFNWFPPSGISDTRSSNPEFNPSVRTRYFVTATTEHGCAVSDSIDVLVDGIVIDMPNAFTPTGGNTFKPVKRGIAKLIDFSIYNRWGNKVFSSSNIDQGWDGTFNGTPQPTGVYVYTIEAVTNDGRTFKQNGNVTLIR
jgi:gliding motility-associated-like protein